MSYPVPFRPVPVYVLGEATAQRGEVFVTTCTKTLADVAKHAGTYTLGEVLSQDFVTSMAWAMQRWGSDNVEDTLAALASLFAHGAVMNLHPNPGSAFALRVVRSRDLFALDIVVGVYERHFRDAFPDALRYLIAEGLLTRSNKSAGAPLPTTAITIQLHHLAEVVPRMLRHLAITHLRMRHSVVAPLFYMDVRQLCAMLLSNLDARLTPVPVPCTKDQAEACLRRALEHAAWAIDTQARQILEHHGVRVS